MLKLNNYRVIHILYFASETETVFRVKLLLSSLMAIKVTLRPDTRYFALRDIDGTERGRYSIRVPQDGRRGQSPHDVALKIAARTTGTKHHPVVIRLRELGTDRVRVYHVWNEPVPFAENAHPFWKGSRTHYLKRFARFKGEELIDGSPPPFCVTTGLFTEYHRRLQDKYDELKAAGKLPETLEREWLEWLSVEVKNSPTLDRMDSITVEMSARNGYQGCKRRPYPKTRH